jgi:5-bromo-4-chloroindolyl phosphate hydrolysis protein
VRVRVNLLDFLRAISGYRGVGEVESEMGEGELLEKYGITEKDLKRMRKACSKGRFKFLTSSSK